MNYLDFVIENYIWFIAGGVVFVMVIIGYFAEKTNFGKVEHKDEPKKKKDKKKSKKDKKKEEIVESIPELPETMSTENMQAEVPLQEPMETLDNMNMEEVITDVDADEEPMADIENVDVDEVISTETNESSVEEPTSEEIPEDLYAGLDGTPNVYKPVEEEENVEKSKNIDMELPNIDALKEDMEEPPMDDDDIWRF